ncbi:MAG: cytochrome c3 family protein [Gemmatimonadota bacterium]|nr:cytochrome c3 family protein [Acidobacteriota bacterium]
MRKALLLVIVLGVTAGGSGQDSVRDTVHNLSVSGPGTVRAAAETRVCVFCHTPHTSSFQAPLWNRQDSGGAYQMYWSETLDAYTSQAAAPQPNGSSKLCLSCHDGTIALGSTIASGDIPMSGGITTLPTASDAYLGQDLSGDHPVSFTVTDHLIATNNAKGDVPLVSLSEMRNHPLVRLDDGDRIQCMTCHDPHHDPFGDFLLTSEPGELCVACHS